MAEPTKEEIEEITELLKEKKELHAIKRYRKITGAGLREAKDWVRDLKARNPEEFPSRLAGCAPVVVLFLVAVGAVVFVGEQVVFS